MARIYGDKVLQASDQNVRVIGDAIQRTAHDEGVDPGADGVVDVGRWLGVNFFGSPGVQ